MAGRAERCCRFTIRTEVFAYFVCFAVDVLSPLPGLVPFHRGLLSFGPPVLERASVVQLNRSG
jgi:hypothetical protein